MKRKRVNVSVWVCVGSRAGRERRRARGREHLRRADVPNDAVSHGGFGSEAELVCGIQSTARDILSVWNNALAGEMSPNQAAEPNTGQRVGGSRKIARAKRGF